MAGYTKLFGSILESTVWLESPPVKVVWITMLAMAGRDGIVEASVPGLAKRAGVERAYCEQALNIFLAPDPDSRTPAFEGRRIEVVAGGWQLLNYDLYRHRASVDDAKAKAAARQRRHRERQKALPVTDEALPSQPVTVEPLLNVTVTQNNPIAEEEEEEEGKEERTERAGAVQVPRAPVAQPTPVAPRPGAPLHATHRAHAACGRVCVPATLHQQFVQALNRDTADAELRAWYSTVNTTWTGGVHKRRRLSLLAGPDQRALAAPSVTCRPNHTSRQGPRRARTRRRLGLVLPTRRRTPRQARLSRRHAPRAPAQG